MATAATQGDLYLAVVKSKDGSAVASIVARPTLNSSSKALAAAKTIQSVGRTFRTQGLKLTVVGSVTRAAGSKNGNGITKLLTILRRESTNCLGAT